MEIEFTNREQDFKNYYKLHYLNEFKKRILFTILLPLLIGFFAAGQPFDLSTFIYASVISVLLLIGFFYLLPYLISVNKLRRLIRTEPECLNKKKISITEEGIKSESVDKNNIWLWESIVSIDSKTQFISLLLVDNRFFLIPKTAFESDSELVNFIGSLQSKISQSIRLSKTRPNYISKKPPYLLGLLCLIPLIGAFFGLVFIILGITRFKDKWFTLIGVAGIVFTVIAYSSLFYASKNFSIFKEGFKDLSQMQLNSLVKEIEYYKIENGAYPDSLQQLSTNKNFISIYDPIQSNQGRENNLFGYERRENFYNLYSVGDDGIPNNDDDFYPEISKNLIGKLGLLNYELETDKFEEKSDRSTN